MATPFLSTANAFLSPSLPSSTSESPLPHSSSSSLAVLQPSRTAKKLPNLCRASNESSSAESPDVVTKRRSLAIFLITGLAFSSLPNAADMNTSSANAAILEADEDDELMEKVKLDRKRRIERQGVLNSAKKETGYLQDVVYNLSKVGQAIENSDLPAAGSVLGKGTNADWVQKANVAFAKLSSGPEEKTEVDTFNSSLASLISSIVGNDIESSKVAFYASASAFEKWTTLTGIITQLKGL
ncbi:unnamed protein product [Linum tenue]|uniref:Maintenance of Photosystem II under High light 2 C-terminal domain-containing protein n=1 Tax=Linum tenue TaxID=586396 RepID=A0AAV0S7Q8_9ROSI|nr:unnamed protein product [Linum tenue]